MALRAFYFIRALTKALIYHYINRSQRHLLAAIENNWFGVPIESIFCSTLFQSVKVHCTPPWIICLFLLLQCQKCLDSTEWFAWVFFTYLDKIKVKLKHLPCEQFLQRLDISRAFLRAKQVGEKRGKFQNVVEIAHKAVFLIFISL